MKHRMLLTAPVLACAAVVVLHAASAEAPAIRRLDGSRITVADASVFARETLARARVTGAQIAVLDEGQLAWSEAFGLRIREEARPMTRETVTWAASITKGVFGAYVMQLVERERFPLDTPVARLLARPLDSYEPYRETASELVKDPAWPAVTPRMLLSHTSGLANFAFIEPDKKMHLHAKPGTKYQYSGEGFNLLQFVIEQRKGQPLDRLEQDALFAPLGMTRTGMIHRKEFEENVADRYDADEHFVAKTRRAPARAAGSMATTADDLARFAAALFDGRVIGKKARRAMLSPWVQIRSRHQFGPDTGEAEGGEAARVGLAYGGGWGLLTRTPFGPAFFKEGHGDGAQNYMICFERRRQCMIILTNSDNGELAFRPLLERILGNTVTPWEWEGYTPSLIEERRRGGQ
jgi:CubicO group peptidase (beta-lactamase class C family)